MALVADLDNILSLAPGLIAGEAINNRLQGRLIKVDQHGYIVHFPLNEVAAVKATGVSERELQLFGKFLRHLRLDVRGDWLIVAPSG